jgi:hypothetical protein
MTGARLNETARATLRAAGFTPAEWIRIHGWEGKWCGDVCGCPDNRCANGFHHVAVKDCGCLPVLLERAVMWREAAREPNLVALAAQLGLWNWVDVSAGGALTTITTSAGPPEETQIRIEPREGWNYAVTYDDSRIEIRLVKAPVVVAADEATPNEGDGGGH